MANRFMTREEVDREIAAPLMRAIAEIIRIKLRKEDLEPFRMGNCLWTPDIETAVELDKKAGELEASARG